MVIYTVLSSSICTSTKTRSMESGDIIILCHSEICLATLDIHFFIGCSNFTNIAYGVYCFESSSFLIMKQWNTELLTNSDDAFCLENQNFLSAPWSIPYVAMPTWINGFWCILIILVISEKSRDPNFTFGQFSWNYNNRKCNCICSPWTFWTNLIMCNSTKYSCTSTSQNFQIFGSS